MKSRRIHSKDIDGLIFTVKGEAISYEKRDENNRENCMIITPCAARISLFMSAGETDIFIAYMCAMYIISYRRKWVVEIILVHLSI